jgi:hypothetical protein
MDMNPKEIEALEALLRAMPLAEPSEGLDRRVRASNPAVARRRRRLAWTGALAACAAAAAVLLAVLGHLGPPREREQPGPVGPVASDDAPDIRAPEEPPTHLAGDPTPTPPDAPPSPDPQTEVIHIEQVWSAVASHDVLVLDGPRPVQRVERQVYRRVQWIDPDRNVHIEWNIPSTQSALMPLEYN